MPLSDISMRELETRADLSDDAPAPVEIDFAERSTKIAVPTRWSSLFLNAEQRAFYDSKHRFNIVPAGRRGGKSEIAKRRGVRKAYRNRSPEGWYLFTAPTHSQAKRIYWNDLKALVAPEMIVPDGISESDLSIQLINDALIQVMGMDVAERAEGKPLDHITLDEYGNMKSGVWTEHIRPMLTDRLGTADFTGVPEGRNHYYDLTLVARDDPEWGLFTWKTADVLFLYLGHRARLENCITPQEVEAYERGDKFLLGRLLAERELSSAKRSMDELTYFQEYEASFVAFSGRAYYQFGEANIQPTKYDPNEPLRLAFDFNVDPGVCVIAQDAPRMTQILDEVYIEVDSRTSRVCDKIIADWGHHPGLVYYYGDASGGARNTTQAEKGGSDWDVIRDKLKAVFGDRVRKRVPKVNPPVRTRVNSMNSRLKTMDGEIHLTVNPKCKRTIRDFEGVRVIPGSAGDLDKKTDPDLTHLTDALGYLITYEHSSKRRVVVSRQLT